MFNNKSMLKSSVPQPLLFQVCQIYSKGLRKCSHSRPSVERYKFSWMWRTEIQKNQKKGIQRVWLLIFFLVYDSYFQLSELLFKWDANLLSQILLPLNINIFMGTLCREKNICRHCDWFWLICFWDNLWSFFPL